MPTRQILLGLALVGAAGTAWADDSMFNTGAGRAGPLAAGDAIGLATPLPGLANPSSPLPQAPMAYLNEDLAIALSPRFVRGKAPVTPGEAAPANLDSGSVEGLNLGLMYRLGEHTWLGLAYASSYERDGTELFPLASPLVGLAPGRPGVALSAAERAPQTVSASIAHQLDGGWMLSASVGWQGWGDVARFGEGSGQGTVLPLGTEQQYRDTWRLSLGAQHQLSERVRWSMGVSYDSSALAGRERTLDDPLPESLSLAAGLSYQMDPAVEFQLGYSLIWLGESQAQARRNRAGSDNFLNTEPAGSTLHVIGGGMVWRF